MADIQLHSTTVALNTTTGTQNVTISGIGTPVSCIGYLTQATTEGVGSTHGQLAMGMTDGNTVEERSVTITAQSATTTTQANRRQHSGDFLYLYDPTQGQGGSPIVQVEHNGFITDGIQLNIIATNGSAYLVTLVFLVGSDVSNVDMGTVNGIAAGATGTDVTSLSFEPDVVLFLGDGDSAANNVHLIYSFGIGINDGLDTQRGLLYYYEDGDTTSDAGCIVVNDGVGGQYFDGSLSWKGVVHDYDANGFSVKTASEASQTDHLLFMALKFTGSPEITLEDLTAPTTTGSTSFTGFGMTPDLGLVVAPDATAYGTDTGSSFAIWTLADNDHNSVNFTVEDAVTTSNATSTQEDGVLSLISDGGSTTVYDGTFTSFDSDGITMNFTTVPGSSRQLWGLFIGTSTGYTITTNTDSYLVTGTSTPLLKDSLAATDAGSYAYTGTAIDFNVGFNLLAGSDFYSYSGTTTNLFKDSIIASNTGSYSYTGTNPNLLKQFKATSNTDSYSYTGEQVNFLRDYLVISGAGSFAYTGTDVTLNYVQDLTLVPSPTSYSYTGTAINLTKASSLAALSESYNYSGTAINLLFGRATTANTDSYTYTGTNITLRADYNISTESELYGVTGTNTSLLYNRNITTTPDSFSYTGTGITLQLNKALSVDSGTYTTTGTAINFLLGKAIAANSGVYALTGDAIALSLNRLMAAESASYSVSGTAISFIAPDEDILSSGSFSYSGTNTPIIADRLMTTSVGGFSYSGTDIQTDITRILSSESNSYTYTGTGIQTDVFRIMSALQDSYSYSGTTAGLLADRILESSTSSFSYSGTLLNLLRGSLIVCDTDSYSYTGTGMLFTVILTAVSEPPVERFIKISEVNRIVKVSDAYSKIIKILN